MPRLALLASLVPGIAWGAGPEPLDLDLRVFDEASAPLAGFPIRVVLDSDPNPRAPGAGRQLVTDSEGLIQHELKVKADRRTIGNYSYLLGWHRVETVKVGFELVSLGGQPILYWLWFDYYTQSASRAGFAYAPDARGQFVRELSFEWDMNKSFGGYRTFPMDSKASAGLPPLKRPPAKLLYDDLWLTRDAQPDGSRRWKLKGRLSVVRWSGDE